VRGINIKTEKVIMENIPITTKKGLFIIISQCGIVSQEIGITNEGFLRRIQYGNGWPCLKHLFKTRMRFARSIIDYDLIEWLKEEKS
jgi:hypothetical protein